MKHLLRLTALSVTLAAALPALADPAVIFDMGGKFDKSFNEAAYRGMERWKKETGKPYLEFEIANETQREQAIRRMRIALSEMMVEGIKTNIPLHQLLMLDVRFNEGGTSIHYLEHQLADLNAVKG